MSGAALAAAACERALPATPSAPASGRRAASLLSANPSQGIWPDVYYRAPAGSRQAYAFAATETPRSLRFIACYCGCVGDGHRNNLDCYVAEFHSNGWVTLDTHGLG